MQTSTHTQFFAAHSHCSYLELPIIVYSIVFQAKFSAEIIFQGIIADQSVMLSKYSILDDLRKWGFRSGL
ncbi:MAG TPA: hypothetical protein VLZ83_02565, partial [Edaphocola sp.]|nr:hypothetical protein [Edaphocola sp.]